MRIGPVLKDWEGTAIPQAGEFEILILTTGHTILVFMLILTVISITVMILCCEIFHKRMICSFSSWRNPILFSIEILVVV